MNKTKLGNALKTIFMLTVLAANAVADDAAIKQQLVGRWEYKGDIMVLRSDGETANSWEKWYVQDGKFVLAKKSGATDPCTILKLTKTQLKIQEDFRGRGITTWTRIATDQ
jgi:hypothetical protein